MMGSWLTIEEDDDDEPSFDEEGRPSFKRWPFLENGAPNHRYMEVFDPSGLGVIVEPFPAGIVELNENV